MPELPMAHIPWSYSLPGLRVWEVEGVPSPPWWQEILAAPLSLLFCQAGGVEIALEHGQVIDAKQQDILLLSQAAPVQGLQGTGPVRQQQIQMTLKREELLEPLLDLWSVPGSRLQAREVLEALHAHGGWLLFPGGLWSSAFFSQLEDLPPEARGEYCVMKSVELLYLLCGEGLRPVEQPCSRRYWDQDQIDAIRQAHDYMLSHISQPMTIESLAHRFHISGTFLKEGFRQMYGLSTRKFLQARRMDLAADLLRHTNQTVLQVATAVGYESASQFSQIFKRHYKLPPAQYRRQLSKRNV